MKLSFFSIWSWWLFFLSWNGISYIYLSSLNIFRRFEHIMSNLALYKESRSFELYRLSYFSYLLRILLCRSIESYHLQVWRTEWFLQCSSIVYTIIIEIFVRSLSYLEKKETIFHHTTLRFILSFRYTISFFSTRRSGYSDLRTRTRYHHTESIENYLFHSLINYIAVYFKFAAVLDEEYLSVFNKLINEFQKEMNTLQMILMIPFFTILYYFFWWIYNRSYHVCQKKIRNYLLYVIKIKGISIHEWSHMIFEQEISYSYFPSFSLSMTLTTFREVLALFRWWLIDEWVWGLLQIE